MTKKTYAHGRNLYDLILSLNAGNDLIETKLVGSEFQCLGALTKKEFDHCAEVKRFLGLT